MQSKNITMGLISISVLVPLMLVGCATVDLIKLRFLVVKNGNMNKLITSYKMVIPNGQLNNLMLF